MVAPLDLTLAALADPTRLRLVQRLAEGPATVTELVRGSGLTQPTISSHLKVLERAGLISRTRVAQTRPCRLEPAGLRALDRWLQDLASVYASNYARLDRLLEELQDPEGTD